MAVAAFLAPTGCSLGADSEPQPVQGAPKAIVATIDGLERAVAHRDWARVCDQLFTKAALERAGGAGCAKRLAVDGAGVRRPSIQIRGIEVKGDTASVKVATTAEGQARLEDTLQLRREGGRWLIEALG
jgi:hypothetical protein